VLAVELLAENCTFIHDFLLGHAFCPLFKFEFRQVQGATLGWSTTTIKKLLLIAVSFVSWVEQSK